MAKRCAKEGCNYWAIKKGFCKVHSPVKTYVIKPFSDKHLEKMKEYRRVRDFYMADHPKCEAQLEGCTKEATDLHHSRGRGQFLCDTRYFKALCRHCHRFVEENPLEAKERGLSGERFTIKKSQ
jgi:hypothetical protein